MSQIGLIPFYRAIDTNGNILASARLYTFATGTTTPQAAYTTDALSVSHGAYVQADANGLFPAFYLDPTKTYRYQLRVSPYSAAVSGCDFDPVNPLTSSSISFLQAGTGADTRTAQAKLRDIVNAADYGFAEAGTGAANASNLGEAITYLSGGGQINLSPGTFTLNPTTMASDITVQGAGMEATIIVQGTTAAGYGVFYAFSGSSTTYVENLTFRDFTIKSTVGTFSEFIYLMSLTGVRNLLIERVRFQGFQGDGLYLGGEVGGSDLTNSANFRHNVNVTVRDCIFDGVNNENRQGITVVDADGLLIDNCHFFDCTKSTMPGAIDFEPNAYAYYVMRNCTVSNCTFTRVGGDAGIISITVPAALTTIPTGFRFINNRTMGNTASASDYYFNFARTFSATDTNTNILIQGHRGTTGVKPFNTTATKGVWIRNSHWTGYTTAALSGFDGATDLIRDGGIEGCQFILCGTNTNESGLIIGKANGFTVRNVTFDRCGYANASYSPILFLTGCTSDRVTLESIEVIGATNQVAAIIAAGHTFTSANNRARNNVFGSLTSAFTSADQIGTAVLVAGVIAVTAPGVAATTRIFVQRNTDGGTIGSSYSITRSAGTSFTITAKKSDGTTETSDTSTMAYQMVPA